MSKQRQKGTAFETDIRMALQALTGAAWQRTGSARPLEGDLECLDPLAPKLLIECKNHNRLALGPWLKAAELRCKKQSSDRDPVIIHKRRSYGSGEEQFATMSVRTLGLLISAAMERAE